MKKKHSWLYLFCRVVKRSYVQCQDEIKGNMKQKSTEFVSAILTSTVKKVHKIEVTLHQVWWMYSRREKNRKECLTDKKCSPLHYSVVQIEKMRMTEIMSEGSRKYRKNTTMDPLMSTSQISMWQWTTLYQ